MNIHWKDWCWSWSTNTWSPDLKSWLIGKNPVGKIEGKKRRGQQGMRWLESITDSMDTNLSKLQEIVEDREPGMLQSMRSQRVWPHLGTEQQQIYIYIHQTFIECLLSTMSIAQGRQWDTEVTKTNKRSFPSWTYIDRELSLMHLMVLCQGVRPMSSTYN